MKTGDYFVAENLGKVQILAEYACMDVCEGESEPHIADMFATMGEAMTVHPELEIKTVYALADENGKFFDDMRLEGSGTIFHTLKEADAFARKEMLSRFGTMNLQKVAENAASIGIEAGNRIAKGELIVDSTVDLAKEIAYTAQEFEKRSYDGDKDYITAIDEFAERVLTKLQADYEDANQLPRAINAVLKKQERETGRWKAIEHADLDLLYRQKMSLVQAYVHPADLDRDVIAGLVSFLDFLLDEAEEKGLFVPPALSE